jgi:hypothetical protein
MAITTGARLVKLCVEVKHKSIYKIRLKYFLQVNNYKHSGDATL